MKKVLVLVVVLLALIISGCDTLFEPKRPDAMVIVKMVAVQNAQMVNSNASGRTSGTLVVSSHHPGLGVVSTDSVSVQEAILGVTRLMLKQVEGAENDNDSTDVDDDDGDHHDGDSTEVDDDEGDHHGNDTTDVDDDNDSTDMDEVLKIEGHFIVDLVNGTSEPPIGFPSVPNARYREIKIRLEPILPTGQSAFVAFEVHRDSTVQKVEFSTNSKIEFKVGNKDGISLGSAPMTELLVILRIESFLASLNLGSATVDADGVIRINEKSNKHLFQFLRARLHTAFKF